MEPLRRSESRYSIFYVLFSRDGKKHDPARSIRAGHPAPAGQPPPRAASLSGRGGRKRVRRRSRVGVGVVVYDEGVQFAEKGHRRSAGFSLELTSYSREGYSALGGDTHLAELGRDKLRGLGFTKSRLRVGQYSLGYADNFLGPGVDGRADLALSSSLDAMRPPISTLSRKP